MPNNREALAGAAAMPLRATGLTLRASPDAAGARAALNLAQSELDRFLLPVNPHWHGNESATSASSASGCPARDRDRAIAIRPPEVRLGGAARFRRGRKGYRLTEP